MKLKEDMGSAVPANSAGAGGVEGIGIGPKGEPPGLSTSQKKKKTLRTILTQTPLKRRQPVSM
jgi:hypothetical protein